MFFKLRVWLGKKLKLKGAPLCRVWNEPKTESYTLRNDGMVVTKNKHYSNYTYMPITMVAVTLIRKFEKELGEKLFSGSPESDAHAEAVEGMNEKGRYKLADYMAHGYELSETSSMSILKRGEDVLILGKDGSIWIAQEAV